MSPKEVLIIGGGFAGLAAGVELSSRGHHVTVLERRGHLGGRAYSYRDPVSGATLDNGQHILMGCYRDTIAFLQKIGTLGKVAFQRNLSVDFVSPGEGPRDPAGKIYRFQSLPLPNPLHLIAGFLTFRGLGWRDKKSLWKLGRYFRNLNGGGASEMALLDRKSIPEFLDEMGQTPRIQERFWDPLTLAALNDRPEVSSAALFAAVLKEALFSGRKGSRIGIPRVGLSELYVDAARDFIERKGGQFVMKAPVVKLHFRGHEFSEVELEGGRRLSADHILVTTPFTALKKILPESLLYEDPFFSSLGKLSSSPIVAINFWFDREVTDRPFLGLWGTKVHWIFNKGRIFGGSSPYLSLVISGAREELHTPGPELIETAKKELLSVLPAARSAKILRVTVTKEPEATLAPAVGISKYRLSQKTPYKNFFLAGDWTDTGLPATIESAVRSANKAVELIEQAS